MNSKFVAVAALALGSTGLLTADPYVPAVGSVWGHPGGPASPSSAPAAAMTSDPLARNVGDLVTIVVDLQNTITKDQNTKTSKDAAVNSVINALLYPPDNTNHGYNFYTYHGAVPTTSWNTTQSFAGGGTVANAETASTTIQARVVEVESNGVLRIEAVRLSKAGDEDTRMILTGLVRPEDLSTNNLISSSRVADLQIVQKGRGTLTEDQRKGWLTKFYEFNNPF
jgi:flagellar L-ring protein precursor FlgH